MFPHIYGIRIEASDHAVTPRMKLAENVPVTPEFRAAAFLGPGEISKRLKLNGSLYMLRKMPTLARFNLSLNADGCATCYPKR